MRRREFIKAALAAPIVVMASIMSPEPIGVRISVEEDDPGYDPRWRGYVGDIQVTCNGKQIELVITADSKEGYVKYFDMVDGMGKQVREMHGRTTIKMNGRHYNA